MELRVLCAAAHRTTWYGRWGYVFGRGGFNIPKAVWWVPPPPKKKNQFGGTSCIGPSLSPA
jgi:hypothetical protein